MTVFKRNVHLGTKDPLIETDDIADKAVTTEKIDNGAVTSEKIAEGGVEWDNVSKDVQNIIASMEKGGVALSGEFGGSEMIGINQKKLTEVIGPEGTLQGNINTEVQRAEDAEEALSGRVSDLEATVGEGGSIDERIATAKSELIDGASEEGDTFKKLEDRLSDVEESVGEGGSVDERIAVETNRAQAAEELLREAYESLSQSQTIPKTAEEWAAMTSWEEGVIYRVAGTTSYTDYMYNGTTTIPMATYNNAIDDEPIAGSDNLVKSGGVYEAQPIKTYDDADSPDLKISDGRGNVLIEAENGHLRTKFFNSKNVLQEKEINTTQSNSVGIADEENNIILLAENGHLRTKFFNSEEVNSIFDYGIPYVNIDNNTGNRIITIKNPNAITISDAFDYTAASDSQFVIDTKKGMCYTLCMTSKTAYYETPGLIRMAVFPLVQPNKVEYFDVASTNDTDYNGEQIGIPYVPNIIEVDNNTIRCFVNIKGGQFLYYRDFDKRTKTWLSALKRVQYNEADMTANILKSIRQSEGYPEGDISEGLKCTCNLSVGAAIKDGYQYVLLGSTSGYPVIFKTSDKLATVEYVGIVPYYSLHEETISYLDGVFYILYRLSTGQYLTTTTDFVTYTEPKQFGTVNQRPQMFIHDNYVYLIVGDNGNLSSGFQRTNLSLLKGKNTTFEKILYIRDDKGVVYPSGCIFGDNYFFIYSSSPIHLDINNGWQGGQYQGKDCVVFLRINKNNN